MSCFNERGLLGMYFWRLGTLLKSYGVDPSGEPQQLKPLGKMENTELS